ncbi:hypothetical protein Pint_26965 [Pistacia integerrima]|uniref:Uncharacterized protein n=1 Tax=Pistacia integerrima TaxID=434235 RepID=A0ACC0YTI9_9ROSI|nr:hypothetical protein Pint_26965 [Pistacia integerrima]
MAPNNFLSAPVPERNCWQRLLQRIAQVQAENGENTRYKGTASPGYKQQEDAAAKDKANEITGQNPDAIKEMKLKISNVQPEKRNGNHGFGEILKKTAQQALQEKAKKAPELEEKKMDSSLRNALGSSHLDVNMKPIGKPDHLLQNKEEKFYGISKGKSSANPGVGDKKMDPKLSETFSNAVQDPAVKTGNSVKPDHLLQNKQENSYQSSAEKSSGSHGAGDKKVDPKLPEASASTIQEVKAKTSGSLIPGQTSQNNQESSYRVPTEKSSGSPGAGDKKVDPKMPGTLGSTIQDAKAKTDNSFVPGSSVLDARAKTGSSFLPGHILQNKLESSCGIPAEKTSGRLGVGDRKVDSKQPEALGSSDQDAKTKAVGNNKPGHLWPHKQGNSYVNPVKKSKGSPEAEDRKTDFKLPETLGRSVQDANAKTGNSHVPGHLMQNKQENCYGSPRNWRQEAMKSTIVQVNSWNCINKNDKYTAPSYAASSGYASKEQHSSYEIHRHKARSY